MRAARLTGSGPTRRTVLQGVVLAGAASMAAGCVGFATTGGGGMVFLSTQFRPVAEAERFRAFLAKTFPGSVSYVTIGWAIAAHRANGNQPMLGLPCGPKGLIHRFLQGYQLPSLGGQITIFRSPEAVTVWQYLKGRWVNTSSSSTDRRQAEQVIQALTVPQAQVELLRSNGMDADVLLMDEPLSNLDALLRLSFRADLKKLVTEIGVTTLYVTHDQVEALSLGDRVAVMREGRIAQCGDPVAVYTEPADEFVGGFLGSPPMNFLTGSVTGDGEEPRIDFGGQTLPVPRALETFQGRELKLGIRPESISVDPDADGLRCEVQVFEPLGSSTLLTTELCGQVLKVQAPASFRAEPGQTLRLGLPPEQCRWYEPESQLLLEAK